jgi:DNA primase
MPSEMMGVWKLRKVWLVEGAMSRYALKRATPLPVLGAATANVSEPQLRFLERFVDVVYCAFDQDSAGDMGFFSARKKLSRKDLRFERVKYGVKGDDPAKVWDRGGLPLLNENFGGIEWL